MKRAFKNLLLAILLLPVFSLYACVELSKFSLGSDYEMLHFNQCHGIWQIIAISYKNNIIVSDIDHHHFNPKDFPEYSWSNNLFIDSPMNGYCNGSDYLLLRFQKSDTFLMITKKDGTVSPIMSRSEMQTKINEKSIHWTSLRSASDYRYVKLSGGIIAACLSLLGAYIYFKRIKVKKF